MQLCTERFANRDAVLVPCARPAWHGGPCRSFGGDVDERH